MSTKRPLDTPPSSSSSSKRAAIHMATKPRLLATLPHPRHTTASIGTSPFRAAPSFQQPTRIGSFSFDAKRGLFHDDRSKRFYRGPPPYTNRHAYSPPHGSRGRVFGGDLNYGMERFVARDERVVEHIDALVMALQFRTESALTEEQRRRWESERRRVDVVTWRGIVTKLCLAYQQSDQNTTRSDAFELNAMLVDNTLYLEEFISSAARAEKERSEADGRMKRFGYYGYAFESFCTVDAEQKVCERLGGMGWGGDVNTNVQWCQVVSTKLGSNRLIIAGEVDAVERNPITAKEELVELKTSMQITCAQTNVARARVERERFERKLLKFFMQSYLLGVGKVVVGFRDRFGVLTTHQVFETLRIPRMVRAGMPIPGEVHPDGTPVVRKTSVWDPNHMLGFGDQMLSFIRTTIHAHSGSTNTDSEAHTHARVYRVSFQPPFHHVQIRVLSAQQVCDEVQAGETHSHQRVGFLPRTFYEFVQRRATPGGS